VTETPVCEKCGETIQPGQELLVGAAFIGSDAPGQQAVVCTTCVRLDRVASALGCEATVADVATAVIERWDGLSDADHAAVEAVVTISVATAKTLEALVSNNGQIPQEKMEKAAAAEHPLTDPHQLVVGVTYTLHGALS
jgi:hypothetical protein